jgi:membrane-associated protein
LDNVTRGTEGKTPKGSAMDQVHQFVSFFLHLDKSLLGLINDYGRWVYLILFVIIFCETGLVVTPFLPGDSLLFAAGVFTTQQPTLANPLNLAMVLVLLTVAAVLGDTVNYWAGHIVGPKAFHYENSRLLNKKHLQRTHEFFEHYGGETIIIARFVPIVRTFAPFVAGLGSMSYPRFISYNVFGGLLWVLVLVLGGHFFANNKVVQEHFSLVILAIIVISILPGVFEFIRQHRKSAGRA